MSYKTAKVKLPKKLDRRRKLSDEDKKAIYEEYHTTDTSWKKLAEKYGVSKKTIGLIVNKDFKKRSKEYQKGRWKIYYDKKSHREYMKEHRRYKHDVLGGMSKEEFVEYQKKTGKSSYELPKNE